MTSRTWPALAILLVAAGCEATHVEETASSTDEGLSVLDWSTPVSLGRPTKTQPAMAVLGNTVFVVVVDYLANLCAGDDDPDNGSMVWFYYQPGPGWSDSYPVPDATTTGPPTLVAFGSHVYLFYASGVDQYYARYDPYPGNGWTQSKLLPFVSLGAPAVAVYGGKLVIVRSEPNQSGRLYWRTMDASENLSAEQPIVRAIDGSGCNGSVQRQSAVANLASTPLQYYEYATSTPALAPFGNCLYLAHRDGSTNTLVYNTFGGGSWGTQLVIPDGQSGSPQTSALQPSLAAFDGALHMVHVGAAVDGAIGWSQLDSNGWSALQALPNQTTSGTPSLAAFPPLNYLMMVDVGQSQRTCGHTPYFPYPSVQYSYYSPPISRVP